MKAILFVLPLLAACASPAEFTPTPMDRRSGDTSYRVEERPGGFVVFTSQAVARFFPEQAEMQASCRREALALAVEEGQRRGLRVEVDERTIRTSAGRNPISGVSSCTGVATAQIVP